MSQPKYEEAFYIDANGVITPNSEAISTNLSSLHGVGAVSTDAANWDGANNAALAANSANSAGNNNLPATLTQGGWLCLKDSAGNNLYIPYWQ